MRNNVKSKEGYIIVYDPNHHRSQSNGYVYEHIIIAEEMLNRLLDENECVHHLDENKQNNSLDNLIIFKTKSDHSRFHKTGLLEKIGDTYIGIENIGLIKKCKYCGKEFKTFRLDLSKAIYCSEKCAKTSNRRCDRPTKQELLNLIKSKTFVDIGKIYNVSDNAIRNWCKSYDLPFKRKDIKDYK
jgi:hypothetical protein